MSSPKQRQINALVLQGGGSRGAFTAGVLDVLMEHNLTFPYIIGTSAGALCGVQLLSGDIGRSRFIATTMMRDRHFLSLRNRIFLGNAFNFRYLFLTVPKKLCPFNARAFLENETPFFAGTTSLETGLPVYFQKNYCREFYKALAASSSLPILAKEVRVEGKPYLDGGPSCPVPFRKPFEDGFEKIIVVATREKGYRKKPNPSSQVFLAKSMYRRKYPKFFEAYMKWPEVYNNDMDDLEKEEAAGRAFVIRPDKPVDVKVREKSAEKLNALYEEGRRIAEMMLPDLLAFMEADHE